MNTTFDIQSLKSDLIEFDEFKKDFTTLME